MSLLTESGNTKDDLKLPTDDNLLSQVNVLPILSVREIMLNKYSDLCGVCFIYISFYNIDCSSVVLIPVISMVIIFLACVESRNIWVVFGFRVNERKEKKVSGISTFHLVGWEESQRK